jgi:hypothetical protein
MEALTLTGVVLQLAYRLRRHQWLGWPLTRWLSLLLIGAGLVQALSGGAGLWLGVGIGLFLLGFAAIQGWAARRRYVHFEVLSDGEDASAGEPLRAEEWVPVRASGWFTVEGKVQYYLDLDADYETVGTGEHIVLGRVHPSRFLWLGRWPAHEWGWWYIFFRPGMVRELHPGRLHFGSRPRRALRVVYAPDEETQKTIYLTFADRQTQQRVWDDLGCTGPTRRRAKEEERHVQ